MAGTVACLRVRFDVGLTGGDSPRYWHGRFVGREPRTPGTVDRSGRGQPCLRQTPRRVAQVIHLRVAHAVGQFHWGRPRRFGGGASPLASADVPPS